MSDTTTEGIKHDTAKDPWHLMPWDALRGIVKVLAFGAGKYTERNWELGMAWSRCHAALHRHLVSWWNREGVDPETGYSHLWHAGCCILFLITFELRGIGTDDRPRAGGAASITELPPGWRFTAGEGGELIKPLPSRPIPAFSPNRRPMDWVDWLLMGSAVAIVSVTITGAVLHYMGVI